MEDKRDLIAVGKKCTVIVNTFVKHIFAGNRKEAKEELMKLTHIESFTQQLDRLLYAQEMLESYFITKVEESKQNISDTMHRLLAIKEELVNTLSIMERNVVLMGYFRGEFDTTVGTLAQIKEEAKQGTHSKSEEEHSNPDFDVLVGKLDVVVESRKKHYEEARNKVTTVQEGLEQSKAQLSETDELLNQHVKEKTTYQLKLKTIQEKILFLEQVVDFWSSTHHIHQNRDGSEDVTSVIFKKATKRCSATANASGSSKLPPHTFIEAWNSEMTLAEKGSSNILKFIFSCAKCGRAHSSTPHVHSTTLTCSACHSSLQKSPTRHVGGNPQ